MSCVKEKWFYPLDLIFDLLILKKFSPAAGNTLCRCSRYLFVCLPNGLAVMEVMSSVSIGQIDLDLGAA